MYWEQVLSFSDAKENLLVCEVLLSRAHANSAKLAPKVVLGTYWEVVVAYDSAKENLLVCEVLLSRGAKAKA